jgi:hypothetical protein
MLLCSSYINDRFLFLCLITIKMLAMAFDRLPEYNESNLRIISSLFHVLWGESISYYWSFWTNY